jgi:ATP-dependent helicase/nuclease subunit A
MLGIYQPGIPIPKALEYLLDKLLADYHCLTDPEYTITISKKIKFPPSLAAVLKEIVTTIVRDEFTISLHRTAGIWNVLHQYDQVYHEWVRRSGKLTFHDIQLLVNHEFPQQHQQDSEGRRLDREEIFYRLDSRFHHWLLDEFQDTSGLQWRILNNLIGEVILDDTHERTFFAVGDIKQCIYRWRGAEPELFFRIEKEFNAPDHERIGIRTLATSYRSAPSVLALPNALFGDTPALASLLPPGSLEMWRYEEHTAAEGNSNFAGYSCVLEVPKPTDEAKASGLKHTDAGLLDVLRNIDPISRGLTCAVLVMRNEEAVRVADLIRAETGWSVVSESKSLYCTDNPVTLAMLDLFRSAAHPRDTLATEHVRMTPLWNAVVGGYKTEKPGWAVLQDLAENGFEKTLQRWGAWLEKHLRREFSRLDDFSQERVRQLTSLARKFDLTGSRDVDAFLDLAENASSAQPGNSNSILVMTWGKSKGLEYDVVLVADLDNTSHGDTFPDDGVKRNPDGSVAWVTELPIKDIALLDPTIAKMGEEFAARQWCENICKLYVAVTRAKRACFVLVPDSEIKADQQQRLDKLVRTRLHQVCHLSAAYPATESVTIFADGDPEWHLAWAQRAAATPAPPEFLDFEDPTPTWFAERTKEAAIRPSDITDVAPTTAAPALFEKDCDAERDLGTALHHLLAQFSWHEDSTTASLQPQPTWAPEFAQRATAAAAAILQHPANTQFLSKASQPHTELWREQAFRVHHADGEIRGVFDRVHLTRDPKTKEITSAHVVEFKLHADLEAHRAQINTYRKALAHLVNLPVDQVSGALLGCNEHYHKI